jgi:hypothetical protein
MNPMTPEPRRAQRNSLRAPPSGAWFRARRTAARARLLLAPIPLALSLRAGLLDHGEPIIPADAHLTHEIGGLDRTGSTAATVAVDGPGFDRAQRVIIGQHAAETNATQWTIRNVTSLRRGDLLLAELWLRGSRQDGRPAQIEFLFERSQEPWTKSASQAVFARTDPLEWRRALIPVQSAEDYAPGEAMVSLRLAFGPQELEIGGLRVVNLGSAWTFEALQTEVARAQPLGPVALRLHPDQRAQRLRGLGGNFTQPRYGRTEPMDAVGRWNLEHLTVVHARTGLPLNYWNPEPGVYRAEGPAGASLEALRLLAGRGLPLVVSIWEGPVWMLGGRPEQHGRTLPAERYADCIAAIVRYLVTARDDYGVQPEYLSFNEPDYGVNFRFTPEQMRAFILQAAPALAAAGLTTRWVAGDTANGRNLVDYVTPLLDDPSTAPHLGPIAFHSWDALHVDAEVYRAIADLGRRHGREIWCLEAGHDAQLWQRPHPWGTWDNAFRTAQAYARTVRLSGASLMSYWTYQDDYPLWNRDTGEPYPVFHILQELERVIRPGAQVATVQTDAAELETLFTVGPSATDFALLLVNPLGLGQLEISGLPVDAPVVVTLLTGTAPAAAAHTRTSPDGRLALELAPHSVTTVTTAGAAAPDR